MDRYRHHKKSSNWKNQNNQNNQNQKNTDSKKVFQFNASNYENAEFNKKRLEAIQVFKAKENICPVCKQRINDMPTAMVEKTSGLPAHFECVIKKIEETEKIGENEKIAYIGQGRFGLLYFENPRDQRKFTIKKVIEYEDKEKNVEWRDEISELYSKIN